MIAILADNPDLACSHLCAKWTERNLHHIDLFVLHEELMWLLSSTVWPENLAVWWMAEPTAKLKSAYIKWVWICAGIDQIGSIEC